MAASSEVLTNPNKSGRAWKVQKNLNKKDLEEIMSLAGHQTSFGSVLD